MIALCTDFGLSGPYTGQVKAVLARMAPDAPVVDLFADLPAFAPQLAAYLLAAYSARFEPGDVILAVVDPGVGSARKALVVEADGLWLVGPDNGLFEPTLRRARTWRAWQLDPRGRPGDRANLSRPRPVCPSGCPSGPGPRAGRARDGAHPTAQLA